MQYRIKFVVMAVMVLLILTGSMGCGKKAPPLPPLAFIPPVPIQLTYQLTADRVTLQWKLDPELQKKPGAIDMAVEVYRAARALTEDACLECPLTFKKRAELPVTSVGHGESLERGYRYFYRLRTVKGNAVFSEYSETLSFDFE